MAEHSVVITYINDIEPHFQLYESKDTAVNISDISGSTKARVIQCPKKQGVMPMLEDDLNVSRQLAGTPQAEPEHPPAHGTLQAIPEGDEDESQSDSDLLLNW